MKAALAAVLFARAGFHMRNTLKSVLAKGIFMSSLPPISPASPNASDVGAPLRDECGRHMPKRWPGRAKGTDAFPQRKGADISGRESMGLD